MLRSALLAVSVGIGVLAEGVISTWEKYPVVLVALVVAGILWRTLESERKERRTADREKIAALEADVKAKDERIKELLSGE